MRLPTIICTEMKENWRRVVRSGEMMAHSSECS